MVGEKTRFPILARHTGLCTVLNNKQLLSVLTGCVWVMALLNPTLNHRIEREKKESARSPVIVGPSKEGALLLLRDDTVT